MKLLTIGEFARLTRLSQKALRRYDELGLLRPARVDPWSGYRYYAPSQAEAARLVAWLRRLGMPLAQIGAVAESPPAEAAATVAAFLRVAEADLEERRRLAQFLIRYFSEGDTTMPDAMPSTPPLAISYAAASDNGLVRARNQDTAYAGPRLLAVADGFGPAGAEASAAAIDAFRHLEAPPLSGDLLNVLSDAAGAAGASVRSIAESDPGLAGSGSTLTAMLLSGARLALVHIGDTRAYLLREGGLFQITHDHSVTQSLIDAGLLTPEEAASHPQRSLLLKALDATAQPALSPKATGATVTAAGAGRPASAGGAGWAVGAGETARAEAGAENAGAAAATPGAKAWEGGATAPAGAGEAGVSARAGEVGAATSADGTLDLSLHEAQAGDRYLLCSDGLTSVVPTAAIRQTLADAGLSPEDVVRRLIGLANDAGGPDNIACAVADVTLAR